jgi:sugar phosphate isomerase/epimerase
MKLTAALVLTLTLALPASPPATGGGVFARDNLVAWCVVPFDAKHRGPKERADMLVRLGVRRIAYDWRDQHIPEWDEELAQYKSHGIELVGFWAPDRHKQILELLKRHGIKSQLWLMPPDPKADTQAAKVEAAADAVLPVAKLAGEYGCTVALYNHGGWAGEPENQVAIVRLLRSRGADNVGVVYNLHHGHEHVSRFPELMKLMKPHLMCLTINGMKKGGPKILPVGLGDDDRALLKAVRDSGYAGPIAILNHREEVDAEVGLKQNIDGLKRLLGEMKDEAALKTYR